MSTRLFVTSLALVALGFGLAQSPAAACDKAELYELRKAAIAKIDRADTAQLATAQYKLGVWARDNGMQEAGDRHLQAALEADSDHAGARDALGFVRLKDAWLTKTEAMTQKGLVLRDGRWILAEEAAILDLPARERAVRKEQQAKVNELLEQYATAPERARKYAEQALGSIDDKYKLEPFAYALRSKYDTVRKLAADELGRIGNRRAIRPLLHRAIYDPSEPVRHAAIDAARAIGDPNLLLPLLRAMEGEDSTKRMRSADAIGRLGDVRGVQYLVYKYEARGGGAPRAFFSQVDQLTFIQDFDVEVAQTAFIADPIVGVIQEGQVLDVQVIATSEVGYFIEREVIHGALSRLTGATDVENKDGAWAAWYRENKDTLAQK